MRLVSRMSKNSEMGLERQIPKSQGHGEGMSLPPSQISQQFLEPSSLLHCSMRLLLPPESLSAEARTDDGTLAAEPERPRSPWGGNSRRVGATASCHQRSRPWAIQDTRLSKDSHTCRKGRDKVLRRDRKLVTRLLSWGTVG